MDLPHTLAVPSFGLFALPQAGLTELNSITNVYNKKQLNSL
jgi:hypothetical protein